jgi:hypothetical protein
VRLFYAAACACAFFVMSAQASAQSLYKCAGVYQDRPCDSEIQNKFSPVTGGFTKQQANPRADARCSQAGGIVQKIREDLDAGKTVDAVTADITKNNGSKLLSKKVSDIVMGVSKMRGTPIQVRYEFEGDCTDQRGMLAQEDRSSSSSYAAPSANDSPNARRAAAQAARAAAEAARDAARSARN